LNIEAIHFVSTAYVSGKHAGNVEEDEMIKEPHFNNAYEKSKYYSELKIRNSGIPYSIYRPSIIVGRRTDGSIRKPLAFYRILEFLAKIKKNFCAKNGLEPSMPLDIPLRFETMFSDKVYLVPMDFVQESMFRLFMKPAENQTYHITGKQPVSTQMIELAIRKFLKMPQIEVLKKVENPTKPEKLLGQFVSDLFPYFSSQMIFNVDNVCKKLGAEALAWEYGLNELYTLTQDFYQKHFPEIVKS
jgi:nucleoside-diphosphate-sugar epimerase